MWGLALRFRHLSKRRLQTAPFINHTVQNRPPVWPLVTFDLLASITFALSAQFHTFACLPYTASTVFKQLDHVGINTGEVIVVASYFLHKFRAVNHGCDDIRPTNQKLRV